MIFSSMDLVNSLIKKITNWYENSIYEDLARGNRSAGHFITLGGIIFGGGTLLFTIALTLVNWNGNLNGSIFSVAIAYLVIYILTSFIFFLFGLMFFYVILIFIRFILNPKGEIDRFFTRFEENQRNHRLAEGRCPNCGYKSTYTRVDGSQRCSKCGWDSRYG